MSLPTRTPVWRIKNSPEDSVVLDSSDEATFALTEEPVPSLEDGEMLVENVYISNDPAQRGLFAVRRRISLSMTMLRLF
jgi:NADPH-dependent curcumin reductase CurA